MLRNINNPSQSARFNGLAVNQLPEMERQMDADINSNSVRAAMGTL